MKVDTASLRQFIIQKFNPDELKTFLFDYFPSVYTQITDGMNQGQRVQLLFDHCLRQNNFPALLTNLKRERPDFDSREFIKSTAEPIVSQPVSEQSIQIGEKGKQNAVEKADDGHVDSFIHPVTGKEMVRIPAGDFLYGRGKKTVYLEEYWIDKTPVTNAEYKRFLDANPHHKVPRAVWGVVGQMFGHGRYEWNKQSRMYQNGKADHPVVLVSWYDAKTYAEWAGGQLPTEQEWEKAARGTDGRIYPWGNEWRDNHCNTRETRIKRTTPVGQFSPHEDSPYGCVDMSGNVWEWTASKSRKYSDRRVLRGGSWHDAQSDACVTARDSYAPDSRSGDFGFLLVARWLPSQGY